MNIFPDSYEGWNMFFQIASVVLVLLTFAAAAGTVITGRVMNIRQAEKILILEKETADAKRAYLELQERLQPRQLTLTQKEQISTVLREQPRGRVELRYIPLNVESLMFMMELFTLFMDAGWDTSLPEPDTSLDTLVGVSLSMNSLENRPAHALTLEKMFLSIDMGVGASPKRELPDGVVILNVGIKPGKY